MAAMSDLRYTDLYQLAGTGKALDAATLEQVNNRDVGLSAHLGVHYTEIADGRVRAELPVGPHLL